MLVASSFAIFPRTRLKPCTNEEGVCPSSNGDTKGWIGKDYDGPSIGHLKFGNGVPPSRRGDLERIGQMDGVLEGGSIPGDLAPCQAFPNPPYRFIKMFTFRSCVTL